MSAWRRLCDWIGERIVMLVAVLVLIYMFIPVAVVVAMSFNVPPSRNVYQFGSFTWHNWTQLCAPEGLCESLLRSMEIGLLATVCATVLGTLMAFALVRHRFAGRAAVNLLIFVMGWVRQGVAPILPASVSAGVVPDAAQFADPLPQALVLTAIVIAFATTALLLVVLLAARGLTGTDHVDGEETDP